MPGLSPVFNARTAEASPAVLGILVCERDDRPPFAESAFLRRLDRIGSRRGLRVMAFAPWTWDWREGTVKGWTWDTGERRWITAREPLPAVAYDRAWPETDDEKRRYRAALRRLRENAKLTLLNGCLPHKGKVYESLAKIGSLRKLIPPTALYRGPDSLSEWLNEYAGAAFLKPIAGSKGRRVAAVSERRDGTVALTGRLNDNRPFRIEAANRREAIDRLARWIGDRSYLMQPLLELNNEDGNPFDLRALMQKDADGRWALTGIAARLGAAGTVTANLHGGGTAAPAYGTLARQFGECRGRELLRKATDASFAIAASLETSFGRMAEIGLDYGIDRNGKLWFLEANAKPGRAAMASAGASAASAAAERPLSYAKSILLRLATTDNRCSPQGNGC
ncbi:YheC/YheD family protein [Cohnella suwonensis]|uniref:YheC/YheD family protein n=1 Tax=Cohnella suwonensis TaxID=696072 RepID=A0ABW0LUK3_9BACL